MGTITYNERMALPPDAVVDVRLIDATRQDATARVVAEKSIDTDGRQVPIPFELGYDASDIEADHQYVVRAGIRSGDQLLFSTTDAHPVITGGSPTRVELVLRRVRTSTDSASGVSGRATVPVENTHWKLAVLGGRPAHLMNDASAPNMELVSAQRRMRGNTGCNGMSGPYVLAGDSLRFGSIIATKRACTDDEMNRQEGILLEALEAARTWRVAGDTLTLVGEPGELARFVAVYRKE
jgi:putative lipoprotein